MGRYWDIRFTWVWAETFVHQGEVQSLVDGNIQGLQDLGNHMGGGHKIDVVASFFLQKQHDGRNLICIGSLAVSLDTDVIILAENTLQAAMGKKDRA